MGSWQAALGKSPSVWWRYGVGLGSVLLALGTSLLLRPFVEPNPFIFFIAAIAISSWYGGLRVGLLSTLLSVLFTDYFFFAPVQLASAAVPNIIRLFVFVLVALLISSLAETRRLSETRYAVTLASLGDGVITTDTAGRVVLMNAIAETLTGWALADARNKPIGEIFTIVNMHTRQPVENPVEKVLRENTIVGLANHTLLLARDGREYVLDDSGAPIRNESGRMVGVVLVFRDVTERAQAETEHQRLLHEAQVARQSLTDVLDRITDAFCAFDLDWRITYINHQATILTRKPADQLLGKIIWEVFPDVVGTTTYLEYHRAIREQIPIAYENYYAPYQQWTETRIYPSAEGLTVFSRDITVEKQAQAIATRNTQRKNRLQAVTALLSQALTPEEIAQVVLTEGLAAIGADAGMVLLLTADGMELEIVQAVGYSDDLLATIRRIPLAVSSPHSDIVRTKTPMFIESREMALQYWPEYAGVHDQIDMHAWANLPLIVSDRVIGALGFGFRHNRTFSEDEQAFKMTLAQQCAQAMERAQLYITEHEARAQAEAAVRVREQFLSIAAHELKTPLTSLLGNAQLIQRRSLRDGSIGQREQRMIQVIVDQARRLDRMVLALLDVSRLETGQLAIKREPMDIIALVQRIIDEIRPSLDHRPLQFISMAHPLYIQGDALRLEQVFQNLIQNAMKYSDPLAPVTVRIEGQDSQVCIKVEDHGIGIEPTELPRLFQRFYRSDSAIVQQTVGMGVGLFVVQEIVNLHGGRVEVQSTKGVGSVFTVYLPRTGSTPGKFG